MAVKRSEIAYQARKLQKGLKKLIETRLTVEKLAVDLEEARVQGEYPTYLYSQYIASPEELYYRSSKITIKNLNCMFIVE